MFTCLVVVVVCMYSIPSMMFSSRCW